MLLSLDTLLFMALLNKLVDSYLLLDVAVFVVSFMCISIFSIYSINTTSKFKRLQFPVLLALAMTINKAQGQSLQM